MQTKIWRMIAVFLLVTMAVSACGPEKVGGFEIPNVQKNKYQCRHGVDWPT